MPYSSRRLKRFAVAAGLLALGGTITPPRGDEPTIRDWQVGGDPATSVDILFVGDGYLQREVGKKFAVDLNRYAKRLLEEEPFLRFKKRFNIRGLVVPSRDRGCDAAANEDLVDSALDCRFDTKDGRLLTVHDDARLLELVKGAGAVDIAFVMVNTERYGGAGATLSGLEGRERPLPAPVFSAQDTTSFLIAIHELGHSFADLADEYVDAGSHRTFPLPSNDVDLADANVTLPSHVDRISFESIAASVKWGHFLALPGAKKHEWLHTGGYYRSSGVLRPWERCRMRDHDDPFCPICDEEIGKAIVACLGETWDDAAWHKERPLSDWK